MGTVAMPKTISLYRGTACKRPATCGRMAAVNVGVARLASPLAYLEVVTAQEERLRAELSLAEVKGEQHQAVIQLYRALGGGWNMGKKEPA